MILASHLVVLPLAFVVGVQQVVDCQAVLTLSHALSSSMVLQRSPARARLWGTDAPGAVVTVAQAAVSTTVDTTGRWSLLLPPHSAGPAFGTGTIVVSSSSSAENNVTLDDVLYGETWLCTGQSNMGLPLGGIGAGNDGHEKLVSWSGAVSWGEQELNETERYPLVRVTEQGMPTANLSCSPWHGRQRCSKDTPMDEAYASGWRANKTKANMYSFSAVCWMYGRRLFDHLQDKEGRPVPVGLMQIAVGGTAVELWSSAEALAKCDQRRAGQMATCQDPRKSVMYHEVTYTNSTLYNAMLHPWTPMAVRGAIWYQGESNVACSEQWAYMQGKNCAMGPQKCADYYACQFPAFIQDLQTRFAEPWRGTSGGFSFLFVQLPSYVEDLPSTTFGGKNDSSLPMLRLAQAAALSLPRVGMATLVDHGYVEGHYGSIHPMDKTPVATRLVLSARQVAYNDSEVLSSGPMLANVTLLENHTLRVAFQPVSDAGLLLRTEGPVRQTCAVGRNQTRAIHVMPMTPVPASQCGSLSGFELRVGAEGNWQPLALPQLSADRRSVLLTLPEREKDLLSAAQAGVAMQLRYLWADWPVPTVYDGAGHGEANDELPAPPFIANVTTKASAVAVQ